MTDAGAEKSAWVADYVDVKGVRRRKSFQRKKAAEAFAAKAAVEVREGVHVADRDTVTVAEAGKLWLASRENAGVERSTLDQYRQHVDLHIAPMIGDEKLSKISVPAVRAFEDKLREEGRSPAMVRKVLVSLGSLLVDAQDRGLVSRNAVREKSRARHKGSDRRQERRQKGKLKVGTDIPSRDEIKTIVDALEGRWQPLLLTAIFAGLRASELRGLRWSDVDLDRRTIHVHQRADRFNQIGGPKSEAGERTVPIPPMVVNTLREWQLTCPKGELDLVFPNGLGNIESHANIINRGLKPAQLRAGVSIATGECDEDGKPIMAAKYTGLHALRHCYASWCINRSEDGGLGLPAKMVRERLRHGSIMVTMDVYGHLFPSVDDADELAAAERALLS